jgi:cystathionine beta-synthase
LAASFAGKRAENLKRYGGDVADPTPGEPEIAGSLLELVGNTPLVRLGRVGADLACDLVAKVELFNPGGSVKDRPAIAMIDEAERAGQLKPGGTIVEPTSGNTGVGLAIVAAQRGYRCIFVMSDKMSDEKVALLRGYGAEVVVCPTAVPPEHPDSYYSVADRLTRETPGAFRPNQYYNQANPAEHERSTGPEIWRQTAGRVTHFVAGVGTGGTITGVGRYLKAQNPKIQVIGADPEGSVFSGGTGRPYLVEGVGEDFWPPTYEPEVVDRVVMATDAESFHAARRVTREEGLLIGGSGGTAVHAALVVGAELGADDLVVVLIPDSGRGYLSKVFNDEWMTRFGFLRSEGPIAGDVLDAKHTAARGREIPELVLITTDEPARRGVALMRDLGVSQLVVTVTKELPLAAKEVSGTLSELALMDKAFRDPSVLDRPVGEVMEPAMPMVGIGETVSDVVDRLDTCTSVLVLDGGHPMGLLTRQDVLAFLAARSPG